MWDGFIKVCAATPEIKVADTEYNHRQILEVLNSVWKKKAKLCVFPELCLTGYTCNDLFLQRILISSAKEELHALVEETSGHETVVVLGLPWEKDSKLYNVAAVVADGKLLGIVPKSYLPNYGEFYEERYFTPGIKTASYVDFFGEQVLFGSNILFCCENIPELIIAVELCEDVWVPNPPSISHAMHGASIIANCSASDELVGKNTYRENLIVGQSARLISAYVYSNAGNGESTQDIVFGGHDIIAENGTILSVSKRFEPDIITADIDIFKIAAERAKTTTFKQDYRQDYLRVGFSLKMEETKLERSFDPAPFVPADDSERKNRCAEILNIQALGLKKRLEHIGCKKVILGLSGGLDSTLALLVCERAFELAHIDRSGIHAVTMPCFGTTDRTYNNACELAKCLNTGFSEINIEKSVKQHFEDIGQDIENRDVTYENAQARERTQVLMDLANKENGLVVGTGDLSELALGWATYNGDHMSMYAVNSSVPKTLIRHLVRYYADNVCLDNKVKSILHDVLDTPVSPELLPPKEGKISQKTEDLVGPYELHDFFLYFMLRFGFGPKKIFRLAKRAFAGSYDDKTILKWLKIFVRRFFSQQFKRSCLPDGPKIGSVALSPRGDLRMPSDASPQIWISELEEMEKS